ncbi:hypothetical protein AB7M16_002386 [Bradyrhizobium sp. USDA 372]
MNPIHGILQPVGERAGNRSCEGRHARPTVELRAGTIAPSRPPCGRKRCVASASCQSACLGGGASSAWTLLVFRSVQPRELELGFPPIQPVQKRCSEDVRELQQQESPLDRGCSWTPPTCSSLGPPLAPARSLPFSANLVVNKFKRRLPRPSQLELFPEGTLQHPANRVFSIPATPAHPRSKSCIVASLEEAASGARAVLMIDQ